MPTVDIQPCAQQLRTQTKTAIQRFKQTHNQTSPTLLGLLANQDQTALMYANWTKRTCQKDDINFKLVTLPRTQLEDAIVEANQDQNVHGIIVYYPVFNSTLDDYLRDVISVDKDVEGLNHRYRYSLYHNIRTMPDKNDRKCVLPCTPLAILKIIHFLGAYKTDKPIGEQLDGKIVIVFNRSEVVGRPLAAMLVNDGATVYSVDVTGMLLYRQGRVPGAIKVEETDKSIDEALAMAEIVVSGVPSASFQIDSNKVRQGAIAINFASASNFSEGIEDRAAAYVPAIGKVTVAILERNLLRLHETS